MLGKGEKMRKAIKALGILIVALFLVSQMSAFVLADEEPNDTFELAESIGEGTHKGTVDLADDVDYYVINIPAHMMVDIVVTADYGSSLDVSLYDQNRSEVDWGYPSDGSSATLTYDPAGNAETVYLKIELDSLTGSGNYTINVSFSESELEGLLEDLTGSFTTLAWACVAGVVLVFVLIVVIIVALLKRKKNTPPPQQYPPAAPPQYPQQPPQQPPNNQQPPQYPPQNP